MDIFRKAVGLGRGRAKRKLQSLIHRYKVPKRVEDSFKKEVMAMVEDGITAALESVGVRSPDAPPIPEPVRDLVAEGRSKKRADDRAKGKAAGHIKAMRLEPEPEEPVPEPPNPGSNPQPFQTF